MNQKLKSQVFGGEQALQVLDMLLEGRHCFHYMPLDNGTVEIAVTHETSLPDPLGFRGMTFDEWMIDVEREINTDEPLPDAARTEFFAYFITGDTPALAVYKDRENACA